MHSKSRNPLFTVLQDDKEHIERYYLKLHKKNDADIIEAIDQKNKQGSIKSLLRDGIKRRNDLD